MGVLTAASQIHRTATRAPGPRALRPWDSEYSSGLLLGGLQARQRLAPEHRAHDIRVEIDVAGPAHGAAFYAFHPLLYVLIASASFFSSSSLMVSFCASSSQIGLPLVWKKARSPFSKAGTSLMATSSRKPLVPE